MLVLLQVSYAIGVAEPLSIFISSYGTGIKSDAELLKIVKANFDLRPGKIVKYVCSAILTCVYYWFLWLGQEAYIFPAVTFQQLWLKLIKFLWTAET